MPARFKLYGHQRSGPTYKVALALALFGAPFDYEHVDLPKGVHKEPGYLAKNRYGQVPCLYDGERYFCQSASILQYLAETLNKFGGRNAEEHARIREWMFWDFDKLAPGIFRSRAFALGIRKAEPAVVDYFKAEGEAGLKVLEEHLAHHAWLAGEQPSIADMDVYGTVFAATGAGFDLARFPKIAAWQKKIEALPGYATPEELCPMGTKAA
jgi:glutathione S-transferase